MGWVGDWEVWWWSQIHIAGLRCFQILQMTEPNVRKILSEDYSKECAKQLLHYRPCV